MDGIRFTSLFTIANFSLHQVIYEYPIAFSQTIQNCDKPALQWPSHPEYDQCQIPGSRHSDPLLKDLVCKRVRDITNVRIIYTKLLF